MSTLKPRFSITVTDELFEKINDFQFSNRIQTQTKAINKILEIGINAIEAEENTPAPQAPTPPPDDDITLLQSLDNIDRAEIRGTMKQMLKADKYQEDTPVSEAI